MTQLKNINTPKTIGLLLMPMLFFFHHTTLAKQNAYTYHSATIDEARWQVGYRSNKRCYESECRSTMGESDFQLYIYADNWRKDMFFSSYGRKNGGWRNELRYNDSFSRSSNKSMSSRIGNYYWRNDAHSDGFTVSQFHMEDAAGPPVRLEYINSDSMEVVFRSNDTCTSKPDCWHHEKINDSARNFKFVNFSLSNSYINVSVNGNTKSWNLNGTNGTGKPAGNWPSNGRYYWKAGIYIQDYGAALIAFEYLNW